MDGHCAISKVDSSTVEPLLPLLVEAPHGNFAEARLPGMEEVEAVVEECREEKGGRVPAVDRPWPINPGLGGTSRHNMSRLVTLCISLLKPFLGGYIKGAGGGS